ncbi:hypothetical protein [Halosegnis marinus]|uniref:hypothetical protein n=1 Tax=Halosegnis marinus TaxID=3034023 RepID=UPI00361AA4F2
MTSGDATGSPAPAGTDGARKEEQRHERESAATRDDAGSRLRSAAVSALYGVLGMVFAVLPVFITTDIPSFASTSRIAGTVAMGGGFVLLGAAAGRVAGVRNSTTRGIAVGGTLVFLTAFVLVFLTV